MNTVPLKHTKRGGLCIKDGSLYQCTSEITTPEAWNSSHWKKISLAGTINSLNTGINNMQASFQDGCDTIVAGCTTYGSTPASNSPDDIVSAIGSIYTNRYNAGKSDSISTVQTISGSASASMGYSTGSTTKTISVTPPTGYKQFVGCYMTYTNNEAYSSSDSDTGGTVSIQSSNATSCTVYFSNNAKGHAGTRASVNVVFIYLV